MIQRRICTNTHFDLQTIILKLDHHLLFSSFFSFKKYFSVEVAEVTAFHTQIKGWAGSKEAPGDPGRGCFIYELQINGGG